MRHVKFSRHIHSERTDSPQRGHEDFFVVLVGYPTSYPIFGSRVSPSQRAWPRRSKCKTGVLAETLTMVTGNGKRPGEDARLSAPESAHQQRGESPRRTEALAVRS
jgi:hypothetical protein